MYRASWQGKLQRTLYRCFQNMVLLLQPLLKHCSTARIDSPTQLKDIRHRSCCSSSGRQKPFMKQSKLVETNVRTNSTRAMQNQARLLNFRGLGLPRYSSLLPSTRLYSPLLSSTTVRSTQLYCIPLYSESAQLRSTPVSSSPLQSPPVPSSLLQSALLH